MTSLQKVIKYLAIAFAFFIIVSIISVILSFVFGVATFFRFKDSISSSIGEMTSTKFEDKDIEKINIDIAYTNLELKSGENFAIETNNEKIKCKQQGKTLKIEEDSYNWFKMNNNAGSLIIYIPDDTEMDEVRIQTGAGKITIESLIANNLRLELGAGETQIENLYVSNKCNIDGGAGSVKISSGEINNLDLDMGVGEVNITSKLTGKNKIDAGIGNLNINLEDEKENYKIDVDKGVGNIKIDGKNASSEEAYGDGKNTIKVDGGIGNINIKFKK